MKTLVKDLGHLAYHGSYLGDWRDDKGPVFERVLKVSRLIGKTFIAEAILEESMCGATQAGKPEYARLFATEFWMLPNNKHFVIFEVRDYDMAFGLYQHDDDLWLIHGELPRIRAFVEKNPYAMSDKGKHAVGIV